MSSTRILFTLSLAVVLGWVAPSRSDDDLRRIAEINKIKAQKPVTDVNAALARDLDPRVAVTMLRRVKDQLEVDTTLPERQREQLLVQVQNRLSAAVADVRRKQDAEENAAQQAAIKRKLDADRAAAGQPDKKTGSPFDTANKTITSANRQLDAINSVKATREKGFNSVLNETLRSAAQIEEQRITERFVALTKLRGPKLDPKEAAILKALNSTLSVDYNMAKFKEVLEDLSEKLAAVKLNVPIIVDENSLKDAMVEYDDPVTFKVKNVTVRTILKKVLGDKGLGYIIKEGTIQVVTAQRARETMVVRSYKVGDLVEADPRYGIFGRQMMMNNVQSLINVIQNASGDPAMWQQGGATISFFEPSRTLIIRAPAELHQMLPQTFGR